MKQIAILALACAALASCTTTRHTTRQSLVIRDTVRIDTGSIVYKDRLVRSTEYIHDTVLSVPAAQAKQTLTPAQLIPGTSYRKDNGNAHSTATIDSAGNIDINCEADSFKIVVRNLTERNTILQDSVNHLSRSSTAKNTYAAASYTDYLKTVTVPRWIKVLLVLFLISEVAIRVSKLRPKITTNGNS